MYGTKPDTLNKKFKYRVEDVDSRVLHINERLTGKVEIIAGRLLAIHPTVHHIGTWADTN